MSEHYPVKTYEELLMSQIGKAFDAVSASDGDKFDKSIELIGMILKLKPDIYNQFEQEKQQHANLARQAFHNLNETLAAYEDPYEREFKEGKETESISWDYRDDVLDSLFTIVGNYNLIPSTTPSFAEISSEPQEPPSPTRFNPIPRQLQDEPESQQQYQQEPKKRVPFQGKFRR